MKYIGKTMIISVAEGKLRINVEVIDFKNSYGKDRWLVRPLEGSGEIWVEKIDIK